MPFWLHGLVRPDHPLPDRSKAGPDLVLLTEDAPDADRLAVVATPRAGDDVTDADAVRHLEVLGRLVLDGPVLPLPLGAVAADLAEARAGLRSARAEGLDRLLADVDGLAEVRVDVRFDREAGLRAAVAHDPGLRRLATTPATAARTQLDQDLLLGERLAARVHTWWQGRFEELLAPLTALARSAVPLPSRSDRRFVLALLVRLQDWPQVERALESLCEQARHEAEISIWGPMPAYDFLPGTAARTGSAGLSVTTDLTVTTGLGAAPGLTGTAEDRPPDPWQPSERWGW